MNEFLEVNVGDVFVNKLTKWEYEVIGQRSVYDKNIGEEVLYLLKRNDEDIREYTSREIYEKYYLVL
jgi:hypothetical protein